jgi:uncharacterized protein YpmS
MTNKVPELVDIVEQEYKIDLDIDKWLKQAQMQIQASSINMFLSHFFSYFLNLKNF